MPGHFTFYTRQLEGNLAFFDEQEARHAITALRYTAGQAIHFTDGFGNRYTGNIEKISKNGFTAAVVSVQSDENLPELQLAVGLLKHADRLEWMVEKCTELGVKKLWLMQTTNAIKNRINEERLQRIAVSALKQSHGCRLPHIRLISFNEVLNQPAESRLICHCQSGDELLSASSADLKGDCLVLIGPEGDFTAQEIERAHAAGFRNLSLGSAVLRTETAAMAVAAAYVVHH
ncbi:MAG: 16S rRNA (uracil(1498)-N(3))-methyltransferase [Bacteroidetes bacterium]|nr:16S rRNA (uracil(1498)-N(3))-methyltransferase [Bacteroidota bacterium]